MMRFVLIVTVLLTSLYGRFFEDYKDFARLMQYETNYEQARQKAIKEKKKLFILFVKEGCPFCSKLEDETLTDVYVRKYIKKNYIPLVINQNESKYPKFLDSYIAPVSYVIDPKTQKIEAKFIGYMESEQYLWQFPSYKK